MIKDCCCFLFPTKMTLRGFFFFFFPCTAAQFPCWTATHRHWIKYSVDLGFIVSPLILHPYSFWETWINSSQRLSGYWYKNMTSRKAPIFFYVPLLCSFSNLPQHASGMCYVRSRLSVKAIGIPYRQTSAIWPLPI